MYAADAGLYANPNHPHSWRLAIGKIHAGICPEEMPVEVSPAPWCSWHL